MAGLDGVVFALRKGMRIAHIIVSEVLQTRSKVRVKNPA